MRPHTLISLGGIEALIGRPDANVFFLVEDGNHTITGGVGHQHDEYEVWKGNVIITDFNIQANGDGLRIPAAPVSGALVNGDSVLTYPGVTITLTGIDLGPVASQYPWLQWSSNPPYYTLGGQH